MSVVFTFIVSKIREINMSVLKVVMFSKMPLYEKGLEGFFRRYSDMEFSTLPISIILNTPECRFKRNTVVIVSDVGLIPDELIIINKFLCRSDDAVYKILYSSKYSKEYFNHFIFNHVNGIVSSRSELQLLKDAIYRVRSYQRYIDNFVAGICLDHENKIDMKACPELTKTERQVFEFMKQGYNEKEIAAKMFVEAKTISTHKSHIFRKFNLKDTKEFLLMAALELLNAGILLLSIFPQENP